MKKKYSRPMVSVMMIQHYSLLTSSYQNVYDKVSDKEQLSREFDFEDEE